VIRRSLVVLWIHDFPKLPSALKRELDGQPIDIHLVDSYRAAVVALQTTLYDAIVIHTNATSVDFVERFRHAGCQTPLVVLDTRAKTPLELATVNNWPATHLVEGSEPTHIVDEVVAHLRAFSSTAAAGSPKGRDGAIFSNNLGADALVEEDFFDRARILANVVRQRQLSPLVSRDLPRHLWSAEGVALTATLIGAMSAPYPNIRVAYASSGSFRTLLGETDKARPIHIARPVFRRRLKTISEPTQPPMAQALLQLENELRRGTRPSARTLADSIGIDGGHLGRRLRRESGLTFCQWRSLFSMTLATRRLVETVTMVSQLAYHLGFQQPSHFAREFRGAMGISAIQYRRLVVALRDEVSLGRQTLPSLLMLNQNDTLPGRLSI